MVLVLIVQLFFFGWGGWGDCYFEGVVFDFVFVFLYVESQVVEWLFGMGGYVEEVCYFLVVDVVDEVEYVFEEVFEVGGEVFELMLEIEYCVEVGQIVLY